MPKRAEVSEGKDPAKGAESPGKAPKDLRGPSVGGKNPQYEGGRDGARSGGDGGGSDPASREEREQLDQPSGGGDASQVADRGTELPIGQGGSDGSISGGPSGKGGWDLSGQKDTQEMIDETNQRLAEQ